MSRKRILKRIAIVVLLFVVACAIAGFLVLRSRWFHQYILAQIVSRAEQATGAKVQVGDFSFHLSTLRVDLYRIAIYGTEPNPAPPLLRVNHVGANLKIVSLIERKFGLRAVEIDRPVVHLVVAADGRTNLPHPPPSKSAPAPAKSPSGPSELFSLAIDHFRLDRGMIDFNDRQIPLQAELRHLQATAAFNGAKSEYDGSLRYRGGNIQVGSLSPVAHRLNLRFAANPAGFRAEPLRISTPDSSLLVRAALVNYASPVVNGSYSIQVAAPEIARVLKYAVRPSGKITTRGKFSYHRTPDRPLLDTLFLSGTLGSHNLSVRVPRVRAQVAALTGRYRLDDGNLTLNEIEANIFGGRLTANGSVESLAAHPRGVITASLKSLSFGALRAAVPENRWAKFPVGGSLNASIKADWVGSFKSLRASSDISLNAIIPAASAGGKPTPVEGTVHARYDAQTGTLALRQTAFHTPQSEISLNGSLGSHAALSLRAQTSDLRETDQLVTEIRRFAASPAARVRPLDISGSASFQGTVQGELPAVELAGQFSAHDLKIEQAAFPLVQAHVVASPSELALSHGEIKAAKGEAQLKASVGLRNWAYAPARPVSLELAAHRMSVAALASLGHLKYPVSGILSAQVSIRGPASRPSGSGDVQIANAEAWSQPIRNMTIHFHGDGKTVYSTLGVETQAGNASAKLTYYPATERYIAQLNVPGLHVGQLHALESKHIRGVATASVRGEGTLKAPELQANLSIPALRIGQQGITGVSAQARLANRVAEFTFSSSFSGVPTHANGNVHLTGDYAATVNISTGRIQAGPLLSSFLPGIAGNIQCETQVEASLRGPLKDPRQIRAHIVIPSFRLARQAIQISSVSAIHADYQNGSLVFRPAEIKGTGTDLRFQATLPLGRSGGVTASANGTVDLHIIQTLYPDWDSSGQLRISLAASGSRAHPQLNGRAQVVNAAFEPPNAPIGVQNMNATIAFNSTRAEITSLRAESGGGSLTASGSVSYAQGGQVDLAVNAQHLRVRYPQGVREVLNAQLRLLGTSQAALLSGQVLIDNLSLTPQFDLTSFASQLNVVSVPSASPGIMNAIKLNVGIKSARQLALTSSQINLRGAADLRVQGTLADPVIVGRATLSGGELFFGGRRFQVESGVIEFINPVMTEPIVDVRIATTINQYALTLNFNGPFDRLRTTYSSSPPLAPADIIHLLLTGQTTEAPGTGLGAQSILAQGIASQVSSRVQRLTGVSSLTIDPQMGGNGTNPGVSFAVQKRVTRNLFFTFTVDTATSQDDAIQVEYQLSRRWSVQATRNQDGGYSLEIKSRKIF